MGYGRDMGGRARVNYHPKRAGHRLVPWHRRNSLRYVTTPTPPPHLNSKRQSRLPPIFLLLNPGDLSGTGPDDEGGERRGRIGPSHEGVLYDRVGREPVPERGATTADPTTSMLPWYRVVCGGATTTRSRVRTSGAWHSGRRVHSPESRTWVWVERDLRRRSHSHDTSTRVFSRSPPFRGG